MPDHSIHPRPLPGLTPDTYAQGLVVWCACGRQIVCYGFEDTTNPAASVAGPWLCLWCALAAHRERPGTIVQAFTTAPVRPGSKWSLS